MQSFHCKNKLYRSHIYRTFGEIDFVATFWKAFCESKVKILIKRIYNDTNVSLFCFSFERYEGNRDVSNLPYNSIQNETIWNFLRYKLQIRYWSHDSYPIRNAIYALLTIIYNFDRNENLNSLDKRKYTDKKKKMNRINIFVKI